jgi:hypothetical protein
MKYAHACQLSMLINIKKWSNHHLAKLTMQSTSRKKEDGGLVILLYQLTYQRECCFIPLYLKDSLDMQFEIMAIVPKA